MATKGPSSCQLHKISMLNEVGLRNWVSLSVTANFWCFSGIVMSILNSHLIRFLGVIRTSLWNFKWASAFRSSRVQLWNVHELYRYEKVCQNCGKDLKGWKSFMSSCLQLIKNMRSLTGSHWKKVLKSLFSWISTKKWDKNFKQH